MLGLGGSCEGRQGGLDQIAGRVVGGLSRRGWAVASIALLALLLCGVPAAAHQPWFNPNGSPDPARPFRLPAAIDISQVVSGGLSGPAAIDYYAFVAPSGFPLNLSLVTPDTAPCADFRPALTLIGPGLAGDDGDAANAAAAPLPPTPAALAEGFPGGGTVTVAGEDWGEFFEPFGGVTFRTGPELERRLDGGEYLVAVWHPSGEPGSYGLSVDGTEVAAEGGDRASFEAAFAGWNRCQPAAEPIGSPVTGR